ncbi:MAG: hypothetical protein DRO13_05715 [Thermoprotei archaeon]|nr:MAG: hypothetical protein DRO13_05715 [Thermoprotei archaeon]
MRGGLRALTVNHSAYPLPVVPILYAVYSVVAGLNTLWSSSFIGLTYLFLLPLWVYIIAKRFNTEHPHVSAILLLSTPLVVIWSVWFIPQAYALLAAIPLLFLELPLVLIFIFGVAVVLGHGGLSLWTLTLLILLVFAKRIFKNRVEVPRSTSIKLAMVALFFITYSNYTTLSMILRGAISDVVEAITLFLAGEKITASTAPPIQRPVSSILGVVPIIVLTVLGAVVLLEHRNTLLRLLAFFSLAGLGLTYVGVATFPALDLPRYIGLGSTVLLAILSLQGVETLTKRGRAGAVYALLLIFLAIASFGFSGTIMPGNPYTANPYSLWSISGLITYEEAKVLNDLSLLLCCNKYLVDWRAGVYLSYKYLWIQPRFRGFYDPETQSVFTFAGSCGLYITPEYLVEYKGVFIFRESATSMVEAFSPDIRAYLLDVVRNTSVSMLYDSHLVKIYYKV